MINPPIFRKKTSAEYSNEMKLKEKIPSILIQPNLMTLSQHDNLTILILKKINIFLKETEMVGFPEQKTNKN